jgi:hypothetical protein
MAEALGQAEEWHLPRGEGGVDPAREPAAADRSQTGDVRGKAFRYAREDNAVLGYSRGAPWKRWWA